MFLFSCGKTGETVEKLFPPFIIFGNVYSTHTIKYIMVITDPVLNTNAILTII